MGWVPHPQNRVKLWWPTGQRTGLDHWSWNCFFDSREQMESSSIDDLCCWPAYSLTPITGQSFLIHRFGRESNLSPLDPWEFKKLTQGVTLAAKKFKLLRKFLSLCNEFRGSTTHEACHWRTLELSYWLLETQWGRVLSHFQWTSCYSLDFSV